MISTGSFRVIFVEDARSITLLTSTDAKAGAEIRAGARPYSALGNSIFMVMEPALIIDRAAPAQNSANVNYVTSGKMIEL